MADAPCRQTIPVNATTETVSVQYDIEKARADKKRDLRQKQHESYTTAIYGSPAEKEACRRDHRQALLSQISEKDRKQRQGMANKVKESEQAVAYDKACLQTDKQKQINRANYLKQFRDGNKQLIETRAEEEKRRREERHRKERDLLKHNPINWSKTLC